MRSALILAPALALLASPALRAQAAPGGAPATTDALAAFALDLEHAVNRRDVAAVNRCIDLRCVLSRATGGLDLTRRQRRMLLDGLRASFDFGRTVVASLGESGSYKLLRVHEVDGSPRALFRMLNDDGGLNYHDLVLARTAVAGVLVVDAYAYMSGELISGTLHRAYESRLGPGTGAEAQRGPRPVAQMDRLMRQGLFPEALGYFERLPEPARGDKVLNIQRVACAMEIGATALDEACDEFRRRFPDDPCVDLVTLDQVMNARRWDDALAAVGRIRRQVGGDPYLDALSAFMQVWAGRPDDALAAVDRALAADPDLVQAHTARLEAALASRDHELTARTLSALEDRFGFVFDDLSQVDDYGEFVTSEAYLAWTAQRSSHAQAR